MYRYLTDLDFRWAMQGGWKCCQFDSIRSTRHESFPLLSIRHTGSRFARDLENIVDLDFEGGLKMLSIRVDSIESTRIVRIDWSLRPRFKNEEGSSIVISRILTSGGLCRVVGNVFDSTRFDRIDTNRFPCCRFVIPEVDLWDATPCESSRIVKCLRRIDSVWVYWTWMGNLSQVKMKFHLPFVFFLYLLHCCFGEFCDEGPPGKYHLSTRFVRLSWLSRGSVDWRNGGQDLLVSRQHSVSQV